MSTVIRAGARVRIRRLGMLPGNLRATAEHTLRRDVVVTKVRRWATFGGVDQFTGEADGYVIYFAGTDTEGYGARNPTRGKPDCPKCSGRGNLHQYAHVQGGKCFACRPILT